MSKRRQFIKQLAAAGILSGIAPVKSFAEMADEADGQAAEPMKPGKPGTLTILQTTDVHCQIRPHDELFWENDHVVFRKTAGYAHIASIFRKIRKENPNTFIVDTGDMFQGSELSARTAGQAISPILNSLGYQLYLPGNWEVIYGKKAMQQLLGGLDAPKVCANMYHDLGEGRRGELIFPPYYVWSAGGVKIGFLGYTDPLVPIRQSPAYSKGIIYTKPEDNLAYYVDVLKNQEQCDMIIMLSHLGLSQQLHLADLPDCAGIDYIMGGDTHERVRKPIQGKYTKVVEPGAFGSFIGRLDIHVKDGKITGHDYALIEVDPLKYKADKDMETLISGLEKPYREDLQKVLGYSTIPLYRYFVVENPIDTLVTDAMMWKIGTDVVMSNGFRFCPPRLPDASGKVPITQSYLFDMLPVDSKIRTGKATGQQILDWLEKELNNVFAKDASKRLGGWVVRTKGLDVEFNAFAEMGKRVKTASIAGVAVDPAKVYTICACEREGDPMSVLCRMPNVADAVTTNHTLHSVLKEYLGAFSPVTPTPRGNMRILDAPQQLLSQVHGVDYNFR